MTPREMLLAKLPEEVSSEKVWVLMRVADTGLFDACAALYAEQVERAERAESEALSLAYSKGNFDDPTGVKNGIRFTGMQEERDALAAKVAALTEALERLSRLGNGDLPGNSEGNVIAQRALTDLPARAEAVMAVVKAAKDVPRDHHDMQALGNALLTMFAALARLEER